MSGKYAHLKGAPLTDLERMCLGFKSRGLRNREIQSLVKLGPRAVEENLFRARHKLGSDTLEQAIAVYTEARILRSIVSGIDRVTDSVVQLPAWRERLAAMAELIDPRPRIVCEHGLHMVNDPCEDCYYTKPGTHDFQPLEYRHPGHGQITIRCARCRRPKKSHQYALRKKEAQK